MKKPLSLPVKEVWQLIEERKVNFIHLRPRNKDGHAHNKGGTTIAWRVAADEEGTPLTEYAVAWCSYADNFCKRTGRTKAAGRLGSDLQRYRMPYFANKKHQIGKLIDEVCAVIEGKEFMMATHGESSAWMESDNTCDVDGPPCFDMDDDDPPMTVRPAHICVHGVVELGCLKCTLADEAAYDAHRAANPLPQDITAPYTGELDAA